jgi:hypothetical protein
VSGWVGEEVSSSAAHHSELKGLVGAEEERSE